MTWVEAAFGYTAEFADALMLLVRQMRVEEAHAGRTDPADAFADGAFDRLIRAAEVAARQHKAALAELDSTGKGRNRASRLGSAAGLLGGAVPTSDLLPERSRLARKGSQLFAGSSFADRADALSLASDTILESSVALVEGLSKRSRSSMRPHSLAVFERRAAHLCRSLLRAHELMLEMIAFEEQRELDWQRTMAVVLDHVARAEYRRRLALSSLEGLLERDKGQLDGQIKGALARRESTISESMLHAQAAGLIASNRYAENIERLREYVSRAGHALDAAAKQGGLR
jgi:hypothetical protein